MATDWWGQPSEFAGSYGHGPRPGVINTVFGMINALTGLADTGTRMYQGYQQRGREKALAPITMAQALYPGQSYQPTEEQAAGIKKYTGYDMPRVTPEYQAGRYAETMPAPAPGTGPQAGLTSPQDPEQQQRMALQGQVGATMPAVGTVQLIGPAAPRTLEEALLRGRLTPQQIAAYRQLHPRTQYGIYKPDTNEMISTGDTRFSVARPYESPEAKEGLQEKRDKAKEDLIRSRPTTEIDEDTGLPTATVTGKVHFRKSDQDKGVTFITPEEAANAAKTGKTLPKGTKVIKENDPDLSEARKYADTMVKRDTEYPSLKPQEQIQRRLDYTKQALTAIKAQKQGGKEGQIPNAAKQIPVNHRQSLSDGSVWENRNGQITRVQ